MLYDNRSLNAMDPLSTTASILTVLRVANSVASLCCDYAAAIKGSSWSLTRVRDETRALRNVLESLEQTSRDAETSSDPEPRLTHLRALCDPSNGPLTQCLQELQRLEEKLSPPLWADRDGSKRKAFVQALTWPFKEAETEKSLQIIGRCKSTITLALSADQQ